MVLGVQLHLVICLPYVFLGALGGRNDTAGMFSCIIAIIVIGLVLQICSMSHAWDHVAKTASVILEALADGGFLAVLSTYVIIYSHILVNRSKDCAQDLRKKYGGILELPLKPTTTGEETTWECIERHAGNSFADFVSGARLLIAWAEDWPQGIIGVALVFRYSGINGLGFAGFSAIISVSKGLLIPYGQRIILLWKAAAVQRALEDLVETDAKQSEWVEKLKNTSDLWSAEEVRDKLQGWLKQPSSEVLDRLGVTAVELYKPIHVQRDQWLASVVKSDDRDKVVKSDGCDTIRCRLVASYLQKGVPATELFRRGHFIGRCKLAGFSVEQCKGIASFDAKGCRNAGFLLSECLQSGCYTLRETMDGGFSADDWKAAGYTAKDFKTHSTVKMCVSAGFTVEECTRAGFARKDAESADYEIKAQQK